MKPESLHTFIPSRRRKKEPKRKDFSPEAIQKREWRKENLNRDPYAVTPDTPEGRERIERGNRLVEQWTAWAIDYANGFINEHPHIPEEDFHHAAFLGMTEASRTYEPSEGEFSTHATWHMRAQIQRLLSKNQRLMSRPRNWRFSLQKLMVELEAMAHEGLSPNFDIACDRMGMSQGQRGALRDTYTVRTMGVVPASSSALVDSATDPLTNIIDREEFHQLREALRKLPGVYVCILIDRFNGMTMAKLSEKYGLSEPTILRYKRRSIEWLKYHMGQGDRPNKELQVLDRFRTHEPPQTGTMVPHGHDDE